MLNKNITENQQKTKIRKRDFKEKTRQDTKKIHRIDENFAIEYFDDVSFMKQKQRRQKKKEREKNKEPKESNN